MLRARARAGHPREAQAAPEAAAEVAARGRPGASAPGARPRRTASWRPPPDDPDEHAWVHGYIGANLVEPLPGKYAHFYLEYLPTLVDLAARASPRRAPARRARNRAARARAGARRSVCVWIPTATSAAAAARLAWTRELLEGGGGEARPRARGRAPFTPLARLNFSSDCCGGGPGARARCRRARRAASSPTTRRACGASASSSRRASSARARRRGRSAAHGGGGGGGGGGLFRPAPDSGEPAERSLLYITRDGDLVQTPRSVSNAREVGAALAKWARERVPPWRVTHVNRLENRTLLEQALLFRRAAIVVAQHGGALANMLALRPQRAALVELPPQKDTCFCEIAGQIGVHYLPVLKQASGLSAPDRPHPPNQSPRAGARAGTRRPLSRARA